MESATWFQKFLMFLKHDIMSFLYIKVRIWTPKSLWRTSSKLLNNQKKFLSIITSVTIMKLHECFIVIIAFVLAYTFNSDQVPSFTLVPINIESNMYLINSQYISIIRLILISVLMFLSFLLLLSYYLLYFYNFINFLE